MKKIISLNGLDNSGKTTQANRILDHNKLCYVAKKLNEYGEWPRLDSGDFPRWWFLNGKTEEVIGTIYQSLKRRNEDIDQANYPLIITDRGDEMFDAVCIATTMVRENCPKSKAESLVQKVRNGYSFPRVDENIFYATGSTSQQMKETYSKRLNGIEGIRETKEIYSKYQKILSRLLLDQLRNGVYSYVIDTIEKSIDSVFKETNKRIVEQFYMHPDISKIRKIVGLGGLSESGKSGLGEYLRDEKYFKRLKIGAIIDQIADKYGENVPTSGRGIYSVGDELLATLFTEKLVKDHIKSNDGKIVIESLRNLGFTQELKKLLGNLFHVVYMDTPLSIRIQRNAQDFDGSLELSSQSIQAKDSVKKSRGAHLIKEISDLVIDNSGDFLSSCNTLNTSLGLN